MCVCVCVCVVCVYTQEDMAEQQVKEAVLAYTMLYMNIDDEVTEVRMYSAHLTAPCTVAFPRCHFH